MEEVNILLEENEISVYTVQKAMNGCCLAVEIIHLRVFLCECSMITIIFIEFIISVQVAYHIDLIPSS